MNFPNPPITEAIFDITANLPSSFNHQDFLNFYEEVKSNFHKINKRMEIKGDVEFQLDQLDEVNPQLLPLYNKTEGYIFTAQDDKKIIQARTNGFTFSKLKPYESWEKFYGEAYQLWEQYSQLTNPVEVTRLGLRYVNKINIPAKGKIELKDYIRTLPEIADNLSVVMEGYFMQLIVYHPEYHPSKAIINQTIGEITENDNGEKLIPLIFDIDVFQEVSISHNEKEKIRNIFESNLRCLRNEIFFKTITDKTKELFQ
ncbi:MAG TPA: TIGR04255 family protein [Leptolyngbyaceae cyanobacterium]